MDVPSLIPQRCAAGDAPTLYGHAPIPTPHAVARVSLTLGSAMSHRVRSGDAASTFRTVLAAWLVRAGAGSPLRLQDQGAPLEAAWEDDDTFASLATRFTAGPAAAAWASLCWHGSGPICPAAASALEVARLHVQATTGEDYALAFDLRTDVFDDETRGRVPGHFLRLLDAMLSDASRPVHAVDVLSADERRRVLREWNPSAMEWPGNHGDVASLLEASLPHAADHAAVLCEGLQVTHGQLHARANRLAWHLRARGLAAGDAVGIYLKRSVEQVVALLAVLKAGGVCVPLETSCPTERLHAMLGDAEPRFVVTTQRLAVGMPAAKARGICLDTEAAAVDAAPSEAPPRTVAPSDPCYVMFTSGSTGRPKGVVLTHGGVVNFLQAAARAPGLGPDDLILSLANATFDPHFVEIHLPLTVGACTAIVPRPTAADGFRLREYVARWKPTVLSATPATFEMLLEVGWPVPADAARAPRIICGGETLSPPLAERLLARAAALWNVYGPTEATVLCACARVERAEHPVPVGRPMDNMRIYVLNAHGQPVPRGVTGEVYVGGSGVSAGYLGQPERTAERFVPDPFGGGRMYRTGDLGRHRADGQLEVLGRADHQIKLHGCRIEPGEVEAVLERHPAVRRAVAMVREDTPGDRRLVAYVAGSPDARPQELRAFARGYLAEAMVPSTVVVLGSLPLNANGKVDRAALPPPPAAACGEKVAPRGALEAQLVAIWEEVLKVSPIGVTDDFRELGGNSLLAMRLLTRMQAALQRPLSVLALMQAHNIEELARQLGG